MKVTIDRSNTKKHELSVGDLMEYADEDSQYIVMVTDPNSQYGHLVKTFSGVVLQSSYSGYTTGDIEQCFDLSAFNPFKGKLTFEV